MGLRVGIVTTWFERGAAYVSRQYRQALEGAHEMYIYARGGESYAVGDPAWDDPRVTWGRQGVVPAAMSVDLDDFGRWLDQNRIEVVFFNEQHWWEPVLYAIDRGLITGAYVDYYTAETVPLFGCYDFLVCNTRRHHGVFGEHPQAHYVPWGTDVRVFTPGSSGAVEPGVVTFFHSCGISPPRKGTDLVLRAFSRVKGPARLVIHAQCALRECFPELGPLIDRATVREGTVAAPGLYHLGDVYVYPSRLDGIGLTIAEALACGLPVITCDNPPMSEFVTALSGKVARVARFQEREDGYYWPQCIVDEDDLAKQMQSYVDDLEGLELAKRCARQYAESFLDWSRNSRELPEIFAAAKRLETPAKRAAMEQARNFERRRARGSARYWLSYWFPGVVRTAREVTRAVGLR